VKTEIFTTLFAKKKGLRQMRSGGWISNFLRPTTKKSSQFTLKLHALASWLWAFTVIA